MNALNSRRHFLTQLGTGVSAASLLGLSPLVRPAFGSEPGLPRKQRLVIIFSPNGTVPSEFWPDEAGEDFEFKRILQPLEPFRDQTLIVKGVCNDIKGDGDGHMRGMAGLLTGIELLPGNIQGGGHTPAGWAGGISIDQEIAGFLQAQPETRTRFGSLEFGVGVANRADPWTRLSYAGKGRPLAPNNNPYEMFARMYGRSKNDDLLRSMLGDVQQELDRFGESAEHAGQAMVGEHVACVSQMQRDLQAAADQKMAVPAPKLPAGVRVVERNVPKIAKMQMDLLVNGFANDLNRVATLQFSNSVGNMRMSWLGINEPHHKISHDPDMKTESQVQLVKINRWFCEQMAYLVQELTDTIDPTTQRPLIEDTLVLWSNELGKGNSHTRQNLPMVMTGNASGFRMGRYLNLKPTVTHNRLHLSLAHAFGHKIDTFGNPEFCQDGPLTQLG